MATVLLVGSHAEVTKYVAFQLKDEGWDVVPAVGPEAGLAAIDDLDEVDAVIVGGPAAYAARGAIIEKVRAKNPFARVLFPDSPHTIPEQLMACFGGPEH